MKRAFVLGLMAALPMALVTARANAQEEEAVPAEQEACTAELMPETIPAGLTAVALEAIFSDDIGEIHDVKVEGGDVGLALAEPDPMVEQEVAEEGVEAEDAGDLARPDYARTLWLNTESAVPGTYRVTLVGETGECAADLIVAEGGVLPEEGGVLPEEHEVAPEEGEVAPEEGEVPPEESAVPEDGGQYGQ